MKPGSDPPRPASWHLGVVLLAAGASSRMGRPKLLLPWGNTTVLGQHWKQWQTLGAQQITVVHAAGDQPLLVELDRLNAPHRVINPRRDDGMFSSIQLAAAWTGWNAHLTHWAIVLGDQPHLANATIQTLLTFAAQHPDAVCQPRQGGHGRHPVILPKPDFLKLANSPHPHLKAHLKATDVRTAPCPIEDPDLALDIDRPEDYALALQRAGLA